MSHLLVLVSTEMVSVSVLLQLEHCLVVVRDVLAVDQFWHEDCLKCSCCECRLGEVGSSLFVKADLLLCRRDYLRSVGLSRLVVVCYGLLLSALPAPDIDALAAARK